MSLKRIQREYAELLRTPAEGIHINELQESNMFKWSGHIDGPKDTPYENGRFKFELDLSTDYPFKAPKLKLTTKIYHPNVDDDGSICMGVLKSEAWKPSTKILDVLLALQNLIAEPNPDDPLSAHKAEQFRSDREAYNAEVRTYVEKYAKA
ncbi:ubiquitin conjugating enzyme Ubc14 [Blastocladiella britannica]|nr:ubiquitin conjugating enzyme Ubc14 [Blastocladiella britannica]